MSPSTTRRRRRIGLRSTGLSMTPAEFDALSAEDVDDCYRYELIRDVLVVSPIESTARRDMTELLGYLLWSHREDHPLGSAIDASLHGQILPSGPNRRRCDHAIWLSLGRTPEPEKGFPAIVIEFVSRSRRDWRRDYEEKRTGYLAAGALEYWIIDRFRRIMTVFKNSPGGVESIVVAEAESYQTALIPGFVLPLARILARADVWNTKKTTRRPPDRGAD